MSGGSFNYLFTKEFPEILNETETLIEMSNWFTKHGYDKLATKNILIVMDIEKFKEDITAKIEALSNVWKAVEWYESGDWTMDDVINHITKIQQR